MIARNFNWWTALALGVLVAAVLVVYSPVWNAQFLSVDDPGYVVDNPHVNTGLRAANVAWAFTHSYESNYHPLTWISLMADCQLFGVTPRWPHVENLLLHILNTILVFLVVAKMTGRTRPSAMVAAIFALHPMHVESVAWVAERKDVLCGLFWLLAMLAYLGYVRQKSAARYLLICAMFLLSLMAKPVAVTLPCALLLIDFWPLGRMKKGNIQNIAGDQPASAAETNSHSGNILSLIREKIPLFAMAAGWCIVTYLAQSGGGAVVSVQRMPIRMRIANALVSYRRYARKFLWPSDLSAFYPLNRPWSLWIVLASAALLIAITTITLLNARRRPWLGVGWLWFMGTLVPMIGLVQVGNASMADRYMYIPMMGLAVIVAWGGAELAERLSQALTRLQWRPALIGGIAGSAAVLACAIVTANDVPYWRQSEPLYRRAIARTEPSVFACYAIATSMMRRHDYRDAAGEFAQCVALQPLNSNVHRALATAYVQLKDYDRAEAQFEAAVHLDPTVAATWSAIGLMDVDRKQWPQAAAHFSKAVQLDPKDPEQWINLAIAHHGMNNQKAALTELDRALALDGGQVNAWYLRGSLLLEMNRPKEAISSLARASALRPENGSFRYRLGLALMESGRGQEAIAPLMAAVELQPGNANALAHLAWLLATHPDQKWRSADSAMFLARRAVELTKGQSADALDALAAAQAEKGQFADAARSADRAQQLARAAGDTKQADQIAGRAAQYRAGHPERDSSLAGADTDDIIR